MIFDLHSERASWSHWQWYKRFFGDAVAKVFVTFITILPIIAKVLQHPAEAKDASGNIEAQLADLFSWKYLWGAAVLYFIAYILYILFCPDFVRKYNNYKEYSDYAHSPRWIVWLSQVIVDDRIQLKKYFERMVTKGYVMPRTDKPSKQPREGSSTVDVLHDQTILFFVYEGKEYQFGMPLLDGNHKVDKDATELATREIFWEIFGRFSAIRPGARLAIIICLFLSISAFVVIVAQYLFAMIHFIF